MRGWEESGEDGERKRVLLTCCGDWDLKTMLPTQLRMSNAAASYDATFMKQWCNIKFAFEKAKINGGTKAYGMAGVLKA